MNMGVAMLSLDEQNYYEKISAHHQKYGLKPLRLLYLGIFVLTLIICLEGYLSYGLIVNGYKEVTNGLIVSVVLAINILGNCVIIKQNHKLIKIADKLYAASRDKIVDYEIREVKE